MGFLDKARSAAETATAKAKEGLEEVQTKRELSAAYDELGKLAFELHEAGELTDERVGSLAEKIRTLKGDLDAS